MQNPYYKEDGCIGKLDDSIILPIKKAISRLLADCFMFLILAKYNFKNKIWLLNIDRSNIFGLNSIFARHLIRHE